MSGGLPTASLQPYCQVVANELFGAIEVVSPEDLPAHLATYEAARRRYERFRDDGGDEGAGGVREPRRPSDSPPGLAARRNQ
jgi:hypothetical protein